jgi:hypothetical protein
LENATDNKLIGVESRFLTSGGVELDVTETIPPLQRGQLGLTKDSQIEILPKEFLSEVNIVLVMATGGEMRVQDVSLSNPTTVRTYLSPLSTQVKDLDTYLTSLNVQVSLKECGEIKQMVVSVSCL